MQDHETHDPRYHHNEAHSRLALSWHGFGSPVGLGILAISIGLTAVLIRIAITGL